METSVLFSAHAKKGQAAWFPAESSLVIHLKRFSIHARFALVAASLRLFVNRARGFTWRHCAFREMATRLMKPAGAWLAGREQICMFRLCETDALKRFRLRKKKRFGGWQRARNVFLPCWLFLPQNGHCISACFVFWNSSFRRYSVITDWLCHFPDDVHTRSLENSHDIIKILFNLNLTSSFAQ